MDWKLMIKGDPERPQLSQHVLQAVDRTQSIQLVDDEPDLIVADVDVHDFEHGHAYPGADCVPKDGYPAGPLREKHDLLFFAHALPDAPLPGLPVS
jgi:hypothetical protein